MRTLLAHNGRFEMARAIGSDSRGKISVVRTWQRYLGFIAPLLAFALYVAVAITWLVPDRRIEDRLANDPS